MTINLKKLVAVLKKKRAAEGLSIRALSSVIGISFSTLARIERGDGAPDNNSMIRLIEWLGEDGRESGLTFENVALVHFRASKNAESKTIHCLLEAANLLLTDYAQQNQKHDPVRSEEQPPAIHSEALSKLEMEKMAENFRKELGVAETVSLDALKIQISDVAVFTPKKVIGLDKKSLSYLQGNGSHDWSAMSVPLSPDFDKWAILRNDKHTIERQRVTYLEECWHILLGHKLTKIAKISDSYGRTYDSNEEHDAYYLASATLLPENALKRLVDAGKTAQEISAKFGVSSELVEYRIKRLHLWKNYKQMAVKLVDADN